MKRILFIHVLLILFTATSFAGGGDEKGKLFKELSAALGTASQTAYKTTDVFKATSFTYNGKTIHTFYDVNNGGLLGFAIPVAVNDLQGEAQNNIQKLFSGWQMTEAMMFIDENGTDSYYVLVTKGKKPGLVLKLNAKNHPSIYARM